MSSKPSLSGAERDAEIDKLTQHFPEPEWPEMRRPGSEGLFRAEAPRTLTREQRSELNRATAALPRERKRGSR